MKRELNPTIVAAIIGAVIVILVGAAAISFFRPAGAASSQGGLRQATPQDIAAARERQRQRNEEFRAMRERRVPGGNP